MTPLSQIEALLKEKRRSWEIYKEQPTRYFNTPTQEEVEFNVRLRPRENALMEAFINDLDALLASLREAGAEQAKKSGDGNG